MQSSQMERSNSQMEMSGPRSGSPNNGDAPSPKRARLDGGNMPQMAQARPGQPGQMQAGSQVGSPPQLPHTPSHPCVYTRARWCFNHNLSPALSSLVQLLHTTH